MAFIATVYTQRAEAKLSKAFNKISKAGEATTQDLVTIGKDYARILVPKGKTGWLYKSIRGRVEPGETEKRGKIFLEPKIVPIDGVHRFSAGNYANFNLARWSHTSSRARSHFNNGQPDFMYKTRDIMSGMTGNVAKGRFSNIKF